MTKPIRREARQDTTSRQEMVANSPQETLLNWYRDHGRDFPWRHTVDTYRVILAEMLLQRTRASQVQPVYSKLVSMYPSPEDLAAARSDSVAHIVASLGLPVRADRLIAMAEALTRMPPESLEDRVQLQQLPGVGDYVADAVEAFVFRRAVCALDANVVRFLGRFYGADVTGEARRRKEIRHLANQFVAGFRPAELNWALLDHGAMVCTPRKPRCHECPVSRWCRWFADETA